MLTDGEILSIAVIKCGADVSYQTNDRGDQWTDFTFMQAELLDFANRIRNEAIEECAKLAEPNFRTAMDIRALKGKGLYEI